MNDFYLEKLELIKSDSEQLAAFNSQGSMVIKAGPGSGKTNILTLKMANLLSEKIIFPRRVACITYSNAAAKEIKERTRKLIDYNHRNSYIGTIHSFCLSQILKPFIKVFDYGIREGFEIISKSDKKKWIQEIMEELKVSPDALKLSDVDRERTYMIEGESQVTIQSYDIALKVARAYEERLIQFNMVDFLSIVKISTNMIQNEPYLHQYLEAKFPYILIDEYQDLGKPLHEMVLTLIEKTKIKLIVVGDPNQTIYGFNGAVPSFLLELEQLKQFETVEFKNNYRSQQSILDASSRTLGLPPGFFSAKSSFTKAPEMNLLKFNGTHQSQYRYIVDKIIPTCIDEGLKYSDISILLRSGYKLKECQEVLEQSSIPCYVMSFEFNRGKFIRFLEECAAWILETRKVYFKDLFKELLELKYDTQPPKRVIKDEKILLYLTLTESKTQISNFKKWISFIYSRHFKDYISLNRHKDDFQDLKDLVKFITENEDKMDLKKFSNLVVQENKVSLLTMHSSKGLEFDVVIMPAMEEGTFPYYKVKEAEMEEENRIFFVSLTRAKSTCYFLMSNSLYGFQRKPSRFLENIELTSIKEVKKRY